MHQEPTQYNGSTPCGYTIVDGKVVDREMVLVQNTHTDT